MCDEKMRLLNAYDQAATEFSERVNTLTREIGKVSKDEYDGMLLVVEKARLASEHARLMLDQHVMKHRC